MSGYNFNSSEDTSSGGGNFLDVECWAHVQVFSVDMTPKNKAGNMIANAICKLQFVILAADVANQEKKLCGETLYPPKQDSKDLGVFSRKKLTRLFIALGLMDPKNAGENVSVDIPAAEGRQMIAHFAKNDKGYYQIAYADTYHIDDLDKANVPRSANMIGQIPNDRRWTPEVQRAWAEIQHAEEKKKDTAYSEAVKPPQTQAKFSSL